MYFITTMNKADTRCVGYVSDLSEAIRVVTYNIGDLYEEGYYPYAVIENIPEGIYQYDTDPMWFKYDEKTKGYIATDKRPSYVGKHSVGFSIG